MVYCEVLSAQGCAELTIHLPDISQTWISNGETISILCHHMKNVFLSQSDFSTNVKVAMVFRKCRTVAGQILDEIRYSKIISVII